MDENSRSSSDSVEIQVGIGENSPTFMNGHMDADQYSDEENGVPYLEIIEQPQQRGFRFRYECEGPSHGGLQGNTTEKFRKTVPTIKIRNFHGPSRVTVSLVTDESVPKAHAHKLVGRHCQEGLCVMDVKPNTPQISFPNLCIQHVTRRRAAEVLQQRICESMILSKKISQNDLNSEQHLSDHEKQMAQQQAEKQARDMKLNVVRLCFQAYLLDDRGHVIKLLESVVSEPIYDSKAPGANALKICRMDKYSGCCTGGEEVFLLCEKVQRDDITVRFVEQDKDGNIQWEEHGHFGPFDVHRQYAIVFKTPEYRDTNIEKPVNVLVMLQRKSDGESSDPKSFTYYPKSLDKEDIARKRKKILPSYNGGSFGDMDPSGHYRGGVGDRGGGSGGGGQGGGSSNGIQNGSIPDFNNMKMNPYGSHPIYMNQGNSDRHMLQARRTMPKHSPDFHQGSNIMSQPAINFITQPQQFVFEEVSTLSPQDAGSSCMAGGSPANLMVGSPNNMSPYTAGSPQQLSVQSPHSMGHTSPTNLVDQSQNCMSTQSMNFGPSQAMMCSDPAMTKTVAIEDTILSSTQVGSQMQQTMEELLIQAQQGQANSLGSDPGLDMDFIISNTADYMQPVSQQQQDMYPGNKMFPIQEGAQEIERQLHTYTQNYGQSCGYLMTRGAGGGSYLPTDIMDMQPALDCVDGTPGTVGMDEVDANFEARFGKMGFSEEPEPVVLKSRRSEDGWVSKESKALKPQTYDIKKEVSEVAEAVTETKEEIKEGLVNPKVAVSVSAGCNSEESQKQDTGVQTDMDTNMLLAMKSSQALHYYAGSGDIRALLMVQRFLMSVQDHNGDLPLHTSLINQKYEVFQNILDVMVTLPDAYSRINAYNFHHQTPLHLAVLTNQPYAVDLLIRAGADSTLVDRNGYTPAHLAVLYGHDECLKNLIKYLRPECTIKLPFPELNARCYDGFSPLHIAAQLGNLAAVKLLVYGRVDVNLTDGKSGRTALHHAVEADELSVAAHLILQAGANVNSKRFDGNTPLHIACGRGNVGMVALLMAGGADPNAENDDSEEIIEDVEEDEPKETVKIEEKDDVDEKDRDSKEVKEQEMKRNEEKDSKKADEENSQKKADEEKGSKKADEAKDTEEDKANKKGTRSHVHKGLVPADFACCNDKILRILNGEPYSSLTEEHRRLQHTTDQISSIKLESGISSMGSDLDRLDYITRLSLSELLDPRQTGSDWLALAEKLGLKNVVDCHLGTNSPTRLLLTYFEESGGTVSKLLQALSDLKREDALCLLKFLDGGQQSQAHTEGSKTALKDPQCDSGNVDSFQKSSSPVHRLGLSS